MTFLDKLKAHIGGLVRLKTEFYWHGPEEDPRRVCLLMDAQKQISPTFFAALARRFGPAATDPVSILIMADGIPKWVWAWPEVLELITDGDQ